MDNSEYENYLQLLEVHLSEKHIDEQLIRCDERYAKLQDIVWNAESEMYAIEQHCEHLWEEKERLTTYISLHRERNDLTP